MKFYFACWNDGEVVAYKTNAERQDAINRYLKKCNVCERREVLNSISIYECTKRELDDGEEDRIFERQAVKKM